MSQSELPLSARWLPAGTFADQVAVVTGGGTGLGLEIARGLAALGAAVVIGSRSSEHHAALLDEGRARGWSVDALELDVREPESVARVAEHVLESRGRVDLLVNNAAGNFVCPAERLSAKGWRAVLGIALDGTFYCCRDFGRAMLARGSGVILNVVATYAWTGMPGVVHSASAKAGVLALSRTLAREWAARGVRVNAIAPGIFESEGAGQRLWPDDETRERVVSAVPLARFASADEIAAHALWLCSPASAYVNGECFTVDGGAWMGPSLWETGRNIKRAKPGAEP
jgi:NAD(P)-dependent dehydrogenase (short-subunit alcohol dehydrogenase family)